MIFVLPGPFVDRGSMRTTLAATRMAECYAAEPRYRRNPCHTLYTRTTATTDSRCWARTSYPTSTNSTPDDALTLTPTGRRPAKAQAHHPNMENHDSTR